MEDVGALIDTFPGQPLDFFGALRAATYDNQIRQWIREEVVKADLTDDDANMRELSRRLINKYVLVWFLVQAAFRREAPHYIICPTCCVCLQGMVVE